MNTTCEECDKWCCTHWCNEHGYVVPLICAWFDLKTKKCKNYDIKPLDCTLYPYHVMYLDDPCPLKGEICY